MKNTTKKNKKNKLDKAYLKQIQNEIDDLERQLFSYDDNINKFKEEKLIFNKNLDEPYKIKNKEENINEENNIQLTNSDTEAERDELYNIILRERKEYNELDEVRKIQNEKIKQTQNKCRALERNNYNIRNDGILQKEKIEHEKKILQLENEINKLKREKNFQ